MQYEVIESRNLVRITFPDDKVVTIYAKPGSNYGDLIEVRSDEGGISLLPIVGSNGIAVKI
jgi:hypothetical protein